MTSSVILFLTIFSNSRTYLLILSVFSEFERTLIRERVIAGQQRAKSEGKHIGRKTNVNDAVITAVYQLRQNNVPIKKIATDLKIGVGTVYKILDKVA